MIKVALSSWKGAGSWRSKMQRMDQFWYKYILSIICSFIFFSLVFYEMNIGGVNIERILCLIWKFMFYTSVFF